MLDENNAEITPRKSFYQIYLTEKKSDTVLLNTTIVAYSESEAIEKVKVGSIIKELKLQREDADFYIAVAGHLYEGETFAETIAKTPELTVTEKANVGKTPDTRMAELETRLQAQELRTENIEVSLQVADKLPLEL